MKSEILSKKQYLFLFHIYSNYYQLQLMLLTHHFELTLLLTNLLHIPTQQINGTKMNIGHIGMYLCHWFVLHALLCLHLNLSLTYLLTNQYLLLLVLKLCYQGYQTVYSFFQLRSILLTKSN